MRHEFPRHLRALCTTLALAAALAAAALCAPSAPAADLPAGAAPGGSRDKPAGQYGADAAQIAESCADNAVLLFTFRGSGAEYGDSSGEGEDLLRKWTDAASRELVSRGHRVRELQAIYPAQAIPASLRRSSWEKYVDSIFVTLDQVGGALRQAHARCPQRKILVAAYSSGALLAGEVLPNLPAEVRAQIASVDLIADPSAAVAADDGMQTPDKLDGRRTRGAWTKLLGDASRSYPKDDGFRSRVSIYCRVPDVVCNLKGTALLDLTLHRNTHKGYEWAAIGERAAGTLPPRQAQGVATPPAATCRPAQNVAVIVDDSGSMASSDENRLRRRALELLLTKPSGQARTIGAIEFGEDAGSLFAPGPVGGHQQAMLAALDRLDDDGWSDGGGGTDYNAAFAASAAAQPAADARIFLTDGEHNADAYADGHVGGPRTYVIGLGIGPAGSGSDADLLARIAAETGGGYFPLQQSAGDDDATQAARLQPAFNAIDALLGCAGLPGQRTQAFSSAGQVGKELTARFGGRKALEVVVSWSSDAARIDLRSAVVCDRRGRVIADLRGSRPRSGRHRRGRRRAKLAYGVIRGATFTTITVRRPRGGVSLRVRLKARTLPGPETANIQSRPLPRVPPLRRTAPPPLTTPQPAPQTPAAEAPAVVAPEQPSTTTPTPATPAEPPRATVPPPLATWSQQQGTHGANTFTNPYNASGMGPKIPPMAWVEVACKVHAPQIASANPDGYWYRIASPPWNGAYYAVANTFWNGDVPGQRPYTHNTDWRVRDC